MMMEPEIGKYTSYAKIKYKVEEVPGRLPPTLACAYLCDYVRNRKAAGDNESCYRMKCKSSEREDKRSVYLRYVGPVKDKRKGAHHAKA